MTLNDRIIAVHVMQRFVRMSRTLLPAFHELSQVQHPSPVQEQRIKRIRIVYDNFKADPEVSNHLIDSNIIYLIQEVYDWLLHGHWEDNSPEYEEFILESDRLINKWDLALMN
ncbi:hypothetical protein JYT25_00410 [bacterium AH-315-C20]|nr:hypothetical protein [bacterium AH-315-C20]